MVKATSEWVELEAKFLKMRLKRCTADLAMLAGISGGHISCDTP